jgi:hypothetical protein
LLSVPMSVTTSIVAPRCPRTTSSNGVKECPLTPIVHEIS